MKMLGRFASSCVALLITGTLICPEAALAVAGPGNANAPLNQNAVNANPCAGGPKSVGFTPYTPKPTPAAVAPLPVRSSGGGPGNNVAVMPAPNVSSKPPPTPIPNMPSGCAFLAAKTVPPAHYAQTLDCSSYALAVVRNGIVISSSFLTSSSNTECDYIFQTAVPVSESLGVTVSKSGQKQTLPAAMIPSSYAGKTTPPFYTQTFTLPF